MGNSELTAGLVQDKGSEPDHSIIITNHLLIQGRYYGNMIMIINILQKFKIPYKWFNMQRSIDYI